MKPMSKTEFESRCYEAYKLDWMLAHGYSLKDYLDALMQEDEEARAAEVYPEGDTKEIFESLNDSFEERGFSGSLWVCKDEFLGAEFEDEGYMLHLFSLMPNPKEMEDFWRVFYSHSKTIEPTIVLPLKEGRLEAFVSVDPDYPGIDIEYISDKEDELEKLTGRSFTRPRVLIEAPISAETQAHDKLQVVVWNNPESEDYSEPKIEFSCAEDLLREKS